MPSWHVACCLPCSVRGGFDHEIPEGERHSGVDHLQHSLHPEIKGCVRIQEMDPVVETVFLKSGNGQPGQHHNAKQGSNKWRRQPSATTIIILIVDIRKFLILILAFATRQHYAA